MTPEEEAREKRLDEACEKLTEIVTALGAEDGQEALADFCTGYVMAKADGLAVVMPHVDRVRRARLALDSLITDVRARVAAILLAENREKEGSMKQ